MNPNNSNDGNLQHVNFQQFKGYDTSVLNNEIQAEEVYKAVKSLKNQKACGIDGINNEMLKIACNANVNIFVQLFNLIFKSAVYPTLWRDNYIKPIFKGGCFNDPSNYRGIAISSCFGKLFSKILHNRLDTFIEDNNILYKGQIGFRKKCRTSDHILTLKTLIDKYFKSSKRLYACFVDLKKAFDTINRCSLIFKLSDLGITADFLDIVRDMYKEVNYCIKVQEGVTENFSSSVGLKQGCILSPTLFSLYINDLIQALNFDLCMPPSCNDEFIPCLLYADDIVLLSESPEGLQNSIDSLHSYCNKWELKVNIEKTKVIVFNKSGKLFKNMQFKYFGKALECVNEYKYLGILFKPSGSFSAAISHLCRKASKAMYSIRRSLFSDKINTLPSIKLFDSCVKPILLYCSEIWCLDNLVTSKCNIEEKHFSCPPVKVQIKFIKHLLGVNRSAVNLAVFSELGVVPISVDALKLSVGFWLHLVNSHDSSLVNNAYKVNYTLNLSFSNKLRMLFEKISFSHVWQNQNTFHKNKLLKAVYNKLKDNFIKFWRTDIFRDSDKGKNKLRTYSKLKSDFELENFLLLNIQKNVLSNFVKLRISDSSLYIEKGRHLNIPLEERVCLLCKSNIEDEFHFVIECNKLEPLRTKLYKNISDIVPSFLSMSKQEKFNFILSSNDYDIMEVCVKGIFELSNLRVNLMKKNSEYRC